MKPWILPIVVAALLTGCSKVTVKNYNELSVGMNRDKVEDILGSPNNCGDAVLKAQSCQWKDGKKTITVQFLGDTVAVYSRQGF
ncbi:outer membrane protein assembly factor BamE [Gallaecimonas mangrovi]|uniref:outer membrane protein assembly factor BamE n=1 Tax=Gallaecimonas mangrovi TaxID=2291597 RepID=UPI000E201C6A|nr:outer membrane protein assembly factor BamE [Gallaecimonas mangrovi]